MATIGDVAREAGVSPSTVSYVLSGKRAISAETTRRVHAAIARLDYTVHLGARALRTARTMTLGVVLRFHHAEFEPAMATYLVALADAAREAGYSLQLITDEDAPAAVGRAVREQRVDGLLLLDVLEDDPRLEPLRRTPFPAVLVGMPPDPGPSDAVDLDFAAAAELLVEHLADRGHRHATLVRWAPEVYAAGHTFALRFARAAHARAAERGLALVDHDSPTTPEAVRADLADLLGGDDRPSALLVHNDAAAAMLPTVLHDLGLRAGQDVAVVSLHSARLASFFAIPFTSVESAPERVARGAVELLTSRLDLTAGAPARRLVVPELVDRGSATGPPRATPGR